MRLLITGGTGFFGQHVVPLLKDKYHVWSPNSKQLNLLNPNCLDKMASFAPDIILHMAAQCGGILSNSHSPADFLTNNITMGTHIYQYAKQAKIKFVHTLGSVCAYPKFCPTPFQEDDLWTGYPEETNAPYGIAKRALLMMAQTHRQQYGIGGTHLIPANLYGEYDHFDLVNGHVIPALIHKIRTAKQDNTALKCWGTGSATRQFLYAGDAALAVAKVVLNDVDYPEPINLGTQEETSITKLATMLSILMDFHGDIEFTGEVSDGQPKRRLETTRASKLLNWQATTSLQRGLSRTIDWFGAQ